MHPLAFVIPGDLALPTGGYAYDRAVIAHLAEAGIAPLHVALPGDYPFPSAGTLAVTAQAIAALPAGCPLLIDGLAYGAMPEALIRGFDRPILALCHHPLALEPGLSAEQAVAFHASEQAALALADHVIVTSGLTGKILTGDFAVPEGKITVAEPGTRRVGRATGSGESTLHLLAVGSIIPRKGYGVLVEALAGLKGRDWQLTIVGAVHAPETKIMLDAQIAREGLAERITFVGGVDEARLDRYYAQADLFVMASLFEGYGMVLAEAMTRGLPILTTTGGAASQTVPDGAGMKVPPGDADAMRLALANLMDNPALRTTLGDAAYAASAALPTWADTTRIITAATRLTLSQQDKR